ncbi:MAG TPA: hypothetical protein VFZ64_01325 [Nocardioidaceae bacterium]
MRIDKEDIVDLLRSRGEHDKASSMDCALPRQVDTDVDAGVLHQFDVNVSEVTEAAAASGRDGARA